MRKIITRLEGQGFRAYAVGGCIRDSVLGRSPKDWDITTSAKPGAVTKVFSGNRSIPTGLKHGTVTVLAGGGAYEVTTFRIDGGYADGRRPDQVFFTDSLEEDLSRRDFTINAMAYNEREGLIDPFGGLSDLRNKTIRCVGDAEARFAEDYLRILRAYRFAAVLGFRMASAVRPACLKHKGKLARISAERTRAEQDKILTSDCFEMIQRYLDDFSDVLLPEVFALRGITQRNPYHYLDAYDHTMAVLSHTPNDLVLRLTALLHDTGKARVKQTDAAGTDHFYGHPAVSAKIALAVLERLRYDNKTTATVTDLVRFHDDRVPPQKKRLRKLISRLGTEKARQCLLFQVADTMGQSAYSQSENLPRLEACFQLYEEIIAAGDPCTVKDLAVTGRDVIETMGIEPGARVGAVLAALLDTVLADPALNDKEKLMDWMRTNKIE